MTFISCRSAPGSPWAGHRRSAPPPPGQTKGALDWLLLQTFWCPLWHPWPCPGFSPRAPCHTDSDSSCAAKPRPPCFPAPGPSLKPGSSLPSQSLRCPKRADTPRGHVNQEERSSGGKRSQPLPCLWTLLEHPSPVGVSEEKEPSPWLMSPFHWLFLTLYPTLLTH